VRKLIDLLPGKTIVTSDHGEAIGDIIYPLIPFRLYGHNKNFRIPSLVNIPWLEINPSEKDKIMIDEYKERKKISNIAKKIRLGNKQF
jgi:hypothetical protein